MSDASNTSRDPVVLAPGEGRDYPMGPLSVSFKADRAETDDAYSISEWWMEPHTKGPGSHFHPEDDVFYIVEGTLSVMVGDRWVEAPEGAFVLVPGGTPHDFENRTDAPAGFLNVSQPGRFEEQMPGIAEWFRTRPPGDAVA